MSIEVFDIKCIGIAHQPRYLYLASSSVTPSSFSSALSSSSGHVAASPWSARPGSTPCGKSRLESWTGERGDNDGRAADGLGANYRDRRDDERTAPDGRRSKGE